MMDFSSAQAVSAMITGAVSIVTAALTAMVTVWLNNRRAMVDEKLARLKGEIDQNLGARRAVVDERLATLKAQLDRELAEQKAFLENKALFAAERVAHELLMHPQWEQRSFSAIKAKLGGFEDDRLRQILVQAGAIRFMVRNNEEFWGLLDRNRHNLG
ncbi:hypothetical protein HUE56_04520 (plasmid) [Azospirillum oryzae]|uniref:Uncharacterized protein n=2 Tax=Azospirillum oryzae TaxID=286727 RepID=A0A6N1AE44_9PROT|nr:hypothetical protein [Azospirillum oryzae]QKS49803.1 hypothetical protein HUE56_04520 [Azospirillum oryzae]